MNPKMTVEDYLAFRQQALVAEIIRRRNAHGLSQQELADLLGCSRSRIARIEAGNGGYTLAEVEVLALRSGLDPLVFLGLTGPDRALLDYAYGNSVSHPALGPVIHCARPAAGAVKQPISPLAWSADSRFLAAPVTRRDDDNAVILCIWEAAGGRLETEIGLDDYVSALAFSPDGRLIAAAGDLDTVEIWDWRERTVVAVLDPVDSGVYTEDGMWDFVHASGYGVIGQLRFSPDGQLLAVYNEDHGTIRLWRVADWRKLATLSIHRMSGEVELQLAQARLGQGWRIERDEAEEEFLYGSSAAPFIFTPDSRLLAVISLDRLDFFTLDGRHAWSIPFSRKVECLDAIGLNQAGSMALLAAGGEGHLFEAWYQQGPYERNFIYTNLDDPPIAGSTIKQLRIINARLVLGLVIRGTRIDNRHPFILNLVSNQPVPLLDVDASALIGQDDVLLAPDGRAVAYQDIHLQLRIQRLEPEYLVSKDRSAALQIQFTRPENSTPAHLREFFEEEQTREAYYESMIEPGGGLKMYELGTPPQARDVSPADETATWLLKLISARAIQKERFGLAYLPPDDSDSIQVLLELVKQRLPAIGQVCLVELPTRGPRVHERMLLGYIAGRRLDQAEATEEIVADLEGRYDLILIDGAERLTYDTGIGLCDHLQDLPGKAFVLITRNETAFIEEADKIRAGSEWLLSRAAVNRNLGRLSQAWPVEATAGRPESDQPMTRFESRLYLLKTATPAAEGGYGLAYLPGYDRTTLNAFVDRVRQQTPDRVAVVTLPDQGARAGLRDIVEGIIGRPLARGELTKPVLQAEVQGQYNLIVIDRAERLHPEAIGWICSHLRDIAEAFLLVVRDEEQFKAEVINKTASPAWTSGRSFDVDLIEWLAVD